MNARKETSADRLLEAVKFSGKMAGKNNSFLGKFHKIHDLDVYGFELGFIQYFCLDVIAVYFMLITMFIYGFTKAVKFICCRKKEKQE